MASCGDLLSATVQRISVNARASYTQSIWNANIHQRFKKLGPILNPARKSTSEVTNGDLESLEKRADALRRQIQRGNERYLKAPDELMSELEKTLLRWKANLADIESKTRLVQLAENAGDVSAFARWWERVKGQLLLVSPIEWADRRTIKRPIVLSDCDRGE
jgi:hypothetical protein